VCGISWCFYNVLHCITYHLQVACTHNQLSIPPVELQQSAHCKYKMCHVWVIKSIATATAGDHWSRCRHRLSLQLSLPLPFLPFCSSHSQWICNDHPGFWIRDGGRQDFKTAERSGGCSNARCRAAYNTMHWVCL
jgi:hypothetical protein